jgi:hypothetical protein
MATTYTWEITSIKADASGGVVQSYWTKKGVDDEGRTGTFNGATPFSVDASAEDYIAFDDLTEADVLGWVQAVVTNDYEEHVNGQIQKQMEANSVSTVAMPWVEPAAAEESVIPPAETPGV